MGFGRDVAAWRAWTNRPAIAGATRSNRSTPSSEAAYAEWRKARVNIDYHIHADGRLYSGPHALMGEEVAVRLRTTTTEGAGLDHDRPSGRGQDLDRRCQMTTLVYFANDDRAHMGAGSMSYGQFSS